MPRLFLNETRAEKAAGVLHNARLEVGGKAPPGATPEEITARRLRLHNNGYSPVPVVGIHVTGVNSPGKQPRMSNWREICSRATPEQIAGWSQSDPDSTNTGILGGKTIAVDIDVLDPDLSAKLGQLAETRLGPSRFRRIGRVPKTLLMYQVEIPHKKLSTPELFLQEDVTNKDAKAQVEILADGQQFVADGIHPDTRAPYHWPDQSPLDIPASHVPLVSPEALHQFIAEAEEILRVAGARTAGEIRDGITARERQGNSAAGIRRGEKPSYQKVADALDHIPNDVDRAGWINMGYAIYEGLGAAGRPLWEKWSRQYHGFNHKHTAEAWRSFSKRREITVGTLFWHAKQHGWCAADAPSMNAPSGKRVAAQSRPETPRPLIRELPPADPFPVDALGDVLSAATRAIYSKVQSPLAICGQSTLAAATLAVQGFSDVELPTGHVKPLSGFFISVASTGERKTATDGEALWAFRKREKALREEYDVRHPQFKNALTAWEKARDNAAKKANGDHAAIRTALDALGPEPIAPLIPMLTCPEPTYEGLCKLLAVGQPSLGIFSAEGGQFIGGHGMSAEAIMRTATGLSCLWDGEPIKRVRAGDGASVLPGRRVSMHLMAQPDVAAVMLSDPLLLSQGLLSRCLVSAPASNAGSRLWHEPAEVSDAAIKHYGNVLFKILQRPLPLVAGKANELLPPVIKLAPEARKIWIGFADDIEVQLKPGGALATVLGLANKLPEHAARLAAVLAMVENIEAREVSADQMSAGVMLAQHYLAEALRMFEAGRITGDLLLAEKLLTWLLGRTDGLISLPDIYQYGPPAIRDKDTATKLVAILVDHGWLHPIEGGAEIEGKYRRDAFRIIKG
jgi:hypothetical protein